MIGPHLSLLFVLSSIRAFPSDRCLVSNKRCDMHEDNLVSSTAGVTGPECKQLCKDTSNCEVYTYFGSDSFPYKELCMLFHSCDTLDICDDCITANLALDCTCGISYEGSITSDNLVHFEADVLTEQDCRRQCSSDPSCSVYTYYNEDHVTDKHLCTLLTELQNPIHTCENCQTAAEKCDAFEECLVSVLDVGEGEIISAAGILVSESTEIRYISGESGCFKTVNGLAVGSGGYGHICSNGYAAGGGSGHINQTKLNVFANINLVVDIDITGTNTILTVENTGEILMIALNGGSSTQCNGTSANGYSGGGGYGGGDGGTEGRDGEVGSESRFEGGKGSGFDISSVDLKYYNLSAGKGGKHIGLIGGGGGGILVDGFGPEESDLSGEGFGGGGPMDSTYDIGSTGCIILEL